MPFGRQETFMLDALGQFFSSVPSEIYVFIISVLPIVELRGAIPVGAALGLPFYTNYLLAVVGNLLPIPFLLMFIPKILDFLARFKIFRPMVDWLRRRATSKSADVLGKENVLPKETEEQQSADPDSRESFEETATSDNTAPVITEETAVQKKGQRVKMSKAVFFGLMLFVAIPLPATGAWTGSLVAALFDLPKKYSFLAILLGVLISGTIMSLASYGVLGFLSIFL